TDRLKAFVKTGDFGEMGKLRYVMAKKTPKGRTHAVVAWTDGSFNVKRMFPKEGDTPGSDPDDAPRPANAKRILTAGVEGAPYGVRVYDAAGTPAEVLAVFDGAMPKNGWTPNRAFAAEVENSRAFQRDGSDFMVFAKPTGDRTVVSVVEMRPRD